MKPLKKKKKKKHDLGLEMQKKTQIYLDEEREM